MAGRKLDRPTGERIALYRTLVTDFLRHEKVETTVAKAKEIKGIAEKMITLGKKGSLHHRRMALAYLTDEEVVRKVFAELAERFRERPGGYTRLVRSGYRRGDAAPLAILELVE
ncbi:MAG: 50S ribosomal protein L17 [Chloroflexi bacterium]|nr:50S ribosomal protein L17 [Chloroflexota bacterium]